MSSHFALLNINLLEVQEKRSNIKNQIENIIDEICSFVSFDTNEKTNLYKTMFSNLSLVSKESPNVNLTPIVDTQNDMYIIAYVDLLQHTPPEQYVTFQPHFNTFCSQISNKNIIGTCAIAKLNIYYTFKDGTITMDTYPTNLDKYELIDVLCSLFVKQGIIAKASGEIVNYTYNNNDPFVPFLKDFNSDFKLIDIEIYNRLLRIVFNTKLSKTSAPLNENASFLCNKFVYGDVYCVLLNKPSYNDELEFTSLSNDIFNRIVQLKKKSEFEGTQTASENYINFEISLHTALETYKSHPDRTLDMLDCVSLNEDN